MKKTILLAVLCAAQFLSAETGVIQNPSFKKADGNWKLSTMADEVFELAYDEKNGFVELNSTGPDYSGYLTQTVAVKPDTTYTLDVSLRHFKGRGLIWITGYDEKNQPLPFDQRKYLISSEGNPLVPFFVKKQWMQGSDNTDWRTESLSFTTKTSEATPRQVYFIRISLGVYFSTAKLQFRHVDLKESAK